MVATNTRRTCTRYTTDGEPCTNRTERTDGWCGDCDGFPRPEPLTRVDPFRAGALMSGNASGWVAVPESVPVEVDEVGSVGVTRCAVRQFTEAHGGTPAGAEVQIRNLLEDLLVRNTRIRRNDRTGVWRLDLHNHGFGLLLASDGSVVTQYLTRHRERSWEQVKAGVPSRSVPSPRAKSSRVKYPWLEEMQAGGPVRVTSGALSLYAHRVLGTRASRSRTPWILERLYEDVAPALEQLARMPDRRGDDVVMVDVAGRSWALAGGTVLGRPVVVGVKDAAGDS